MDGDLREAVGRIEAKLDGCCDTIKEMKISLYAEPDGYGARIRKAENRLTKIETKAGIIAFIVSLVMGAGIWILRLWNGR